MAPIGAFLLLDSAALVEKSLAPGAFPPGPRGSLKIAEMLDFSHP
jgi:hypothetical protein